MLKKGNPMPHLMPHLLYVSATDSTAACVTISAALRQAAAGDTVLVGRGRYAPSTTGEQFPLYVPPGVTLTGEGQGVSVIDGEGVTELSFRPVQAGQSLILLGDGTTLRDLMVANIGICQSPCLKAQADLVARDLMNCYMGHRLVVLLIGHEAQRYSCNWKRMACRSSWPRFTSTNSPSSYSSRLLSSVRI